MRDRYQTDNTEEGNKIFDVISGVKYGPELGEEGIAKERTYDERCAFLLTKSGILYDSKQKALIILETEVCDSDKTEKKVGDSHITIIHPSQEARRTVKTKLEKVLGFELREK